MQLFQQEREPKASGTFYGAIRGVRLTALDEEQQYANELLGQALANNEGGRHVARIAHLYFARMPNLTPADYEQHIMSLVRKIFGPSPMPTGSAVEWGWLGSFNSPAAGKLSLPRSLKEELRRDFDSTFNKDKWGSEEQKAFRVFQLLDPEENENLFSVVYFRPFNQFHYPFALSELPPRTEETLNVWRLGSQDVYVPALYVQLCGEPPRIVDGYLQIDLADWFTLRFVNWFVGDLNRSPHVIQSQLRLSNHDDRRMSFDMLSVGDLIAGNPALETLLSYLESFMPHEGKVSCSERKLSARACAVFRWSICDLWLNRLKLAPSDPWVPPPSTRLLQSLFLLCIHISADPGLINLNGTRGQNFVLSVNSLTFRTPILRYFTYWVAEWPSDRDSSLDAFISLWATYLTPWKAISRMKIKSDRPLEKLVPFNSGVRGGDSDGTAEITSDRWLWFIASHFLHYLMYLRRTLERIDQESNPNLATLEAYARSFRDNGPLCPQVLCALLACENVISGEDTEMPPAIESLKDRPKIVSFVQEHADAISGMIQGQMDEYYMKNVPSALNELRILSGLGDQIRSFMRELMHKRKAGSPFPVSGLVHAGNHSEFERLSRIFDVKIDVNAPASGSLMSKLTSMGAPDSEWRVGAPSWLKHRSSTPIRFRALTPTGRKQIRSGLREGNPELTAQYIGDFAQRPLADHEIPILVEAIKWIAKFEAQTGVKADILRSFADSRNLAWALALIDLIALLYASKRVTVTIALSIVYVLGAGQVRGFASQLWNAIFLVSLLYSTFETSNN